MIERKAVLEVYECPSGDIKDVLLQGELPNEQNADNVRLLAVRIILLYILVTFSIAPANLVAK